MRLFSHKTKKVKGKLCPPNYFIFVPPRISVIDLMIKPISEILGGQILPFNALIVT